MSTRKLASSRIGKGNTHFSDPTYTTNLGNVCNVLVAMLKPYYALSHPMYEEQWTDCARQQADNKLQGVHHLQLMQRPFAFVSLGPELQEEAVQEEMHVAAQNLQYVAPAQDHLCSVTIQFAL